MSGTTLYLVWNSNKSECVGFLDKQDAKYASTGTQTSIGYSSIAGEFREIYEDQADENGVLPMTTVQI